MRSDLLASGPGWSVRNLVCSAGPSDRAFEEEHTSACIALVAAGTFRYRARQGAAMLVPGAILLGNRGTCFECGHEHSTGDRCISFHYAEAHLDAIRAEVSGARGGAFAAPHETTAALAADIVHAAADPSGEAFEELAYRLAGAAFTRLAGDAERAPLVRARDVRRVTEAVRRIEANAADRHPLSRLARDAGVSPFHFLRVFKRVVGMTPHRYVLETRLHRAAIRLLRSRDPILTITVEEGFDDLSTFNRRFKRTMGVSPGVFRRRGSIPDELDHRVAEIVRR